MVVIGSNSSSWQILLLVVDGVSAQFGFLVFHDLRNLLPLDSLRVEN